MNEFLSAVSLFLAGVFTVITAAKFAMLYIERYQPLELRMLMYNPFWWSIMAGISWIGVFTL